MTTTQFLSILAKHWKTLLTTAVIGAVFGLLVSVAMPVKYQANMELLILQRYAFARDAYTASKSIEYLSSVFGQAVYSQNFIDEVLSSGYRIANTFSKNTERRKKEWKKIVRAKVSRDTGILTVTTVHRSADQAQQITEAILSILFTKGDQYHGEGDRVKIQVLDAPSLSQYVASPNMPANAAAGALLAVLACLAVLASGRQFELTPSTIKKLLSPETPQEQEPAQDPLEQFTPAPQYVFETIETPYVTSAEVREQKPDIGYRVSNIGFQERPTLGKSVKEIKRQMHGN